MNDQTRDPITKHAVPKFSEQGDYASVTFNLFNGEADGQQVRSHHSALSVTVSNRLVRTRNGRCRFIDSWVLCKLLLGIDTKDFGTDLEEAQVKECRLKRVHEYDAWLNIAFSAGHVVTPLPNVVMTDEERIAAINEALKLKELQNLPREVYEEILAGRIDVVHIHSKNPRQGETASNGMQISRDFSRNVEMNRVRRAYMKRLWANEFIVPLDRLRWDQPVSESRYYLGRTGREEKTKTVYSGFVIVSRPWPDYVYHTPTTRGTWKPGYNGRGLIIIIETDVEKDYVGYAIQSTFQWLIDEQEGFVRNYPIYAKNPDQAAKDAGVGAEAPTKGEEEDEEDQTNSNGKGETSGNTEPPPREILRVPVSEALASA